MDPPSFHSDRINIYAGETFTRLHIPISHVTHIDNFPLKKKQSREKETDIFKTRNGTWRENGQTCFARDPIKFPVKMTTN